MPLERISSADAFSRLRQVDASRWPDGRSFTRRLNAPVHVDARPGFSISSGDAVLTIGSEAVSCRSSHFFAA